jgi:hypothetical protein
MYAQKRELLLARKRPQPCSICGASMFPVAGGTLYRHPKGSLERCNRILMAGRVIKTTEKEPTQ